MNLFSISIFYAIMTARLNCENVAKISASVGECFLQLIWQSDDATDRSLHNELAPRIHNLH